jgi:hypothetical protein
MADEDLEEDLKDEALESIAREYHRLNPPGVRLFLSAAALEAVVSAAAGAFLIPYLKVLGEKAGEKTWQILTSMKRKPKEQDSPVVKDCIELIKGSSLEERQAAYERAKLEVTKLLIQNNFTEQACSRVVESMNAVMESKASSSQGSKPPRERS